MKGRGSGFVVIEIRKLRKQVGGRLALEVDTLTVDAGEVAAVTGPAESGREILFDLLTGHIRPSAGTVRLAGLDPWSEKEAFSRKVGVLFQKDGLYKHLSLLDNLSMYCQLYGLPNARAEQVLALVGLADQAKVLSVKLPTGWQRRLAFGRAILHSPLVLLLYDPFARCDQPSIDLLGKLIREQVEGGEERHGGTAVMILAEESSYLSPLCDHVYTLSQGQLTVQAQAEKETPTAMPFKIPVRLEDKVILVNPAEVLFVEAVRKRVCLHTSDTSLPTHFTLNELEERLSRSGFFRAHRSYLVNLQHVKEVITYTRNSFSMRLDDAANTVIPLSKAAASELRELLGY
jgi:ABC-2 type transport system ATP-binding protein